MTPQRASPISLNFLRPRPSHPLQQPTVHTDKPLQQHRAMSHLMCCASHFIKMNHLKLWCIVGYWNWWMFSLVSDACWMNVKWCWMHVACMLQALKSVLNAFEFFIAFVSASARHSLILPHSSSAATTALDPKTWHAHHGGKWQWDTASHP